MTFLLIYKIILILTENESETKCVAINFTNRII